MGRKSCKEDGCQICNFFYGSAALLSLLLSLQKLFKDEIIDSKGVPLKDHMVQLSTTMLSMDSTRFIWACIGDSDLNKIIFDTTLLEGKGGSGSYNLHLNYGAETWGVHPLPKDVANRPRFRN